MFKLKERLEKSDNIQLYTKGLTKPEDFKICIQ